MDVLDDGAWRTHRLFGQLTFVKPGDLQAIAGHTDFLGLNYYNRHVARGPDNADDVNLPRLVHESAERSEMGWEVYPEGLFKLLARVYYDYYPQKIYITENGVSYSDGPGPDGRVQDERRRSYIHRHLIQAQRAIQAGVPLAGYFAWSLLDNFEWARGYSQRVGLVWVDFATQQRILKDSALWYRQAAGSSLFLLSPPPESRCIYSGL